MALEDIRHLARAFLVDLANCVCPEEQVGKLADQAERLKEQIRLGYDDLLRQRRFVEGLHERIAEHEQKETALPWQVQTFLQVGNRSGAYRAALELDRVRGMLDHDRARLRQLEATYQKQVTRLERERKHLGQLQLELLRVRPGVRAV